MSAAVESWWRERGLGCPPALVQLLADPPRELEHLLYRPGLSQHAAPSVDWAIGLAESSAWPLPQSLVPILPVDEASMACVDGATDGREADVEAIPVLRWHLELEDMEHQAALLDVEPVLYVESVVRELSARPVGLHRMLDEIGPWYEANYLDKEKRPRDFVLRPVRLACQNVILGYAAFAQDTSFDGLSVLAWQTCELPHVAAHEGNRALAALTLCDAYQSGGTMEIRFDHGVALEPTDVVTSTGRRVQVDATYAGHPEMDVPASLRRYGRTVGVALGSERPGSISPAEARELFLAVTPMTDELAVRVSAAAQAGIATIERLCFSLLLPVWRDIELDFLLGVSDRTGELVNGGQPWYCRPARQAEMQLARSALMVGMLHRRLNATDAAGAASEARVFEDSRVGVTWSVVEDIGSVAFDGLAAGRLPWQDGSVAAPEPGSLVVVPRAVPTQGDVEIVRSVAAASGAALVVPADADLRHLALGDITVLRCPDRIGELDLAIEGKLLTARTARA